ncbi:MAG: hypothetical protein OXI39_08670 [Gemmatimonadota bacterium]|uniref:hypothetical protein n=1 Tax=Candidatus Palauibacter scopulicola TaxID=3056741 RepID=UPI00238D9EEE|nr:hypothetical protein [Candidatus Palauibacter scopulicola]MDE2663061.1 hypothetical protein [Candidatus Palauibacter scopulicola]
MLRFVPADECDEDAALEGDGESVALVALGLLVLVAGSVVRAAPGRADRVRSLHALPLFWPSLPDPLLLVEKPRESPRLGALRSFRISETRR